MEMTPKILSRRVLYTTPWMQLIEKQVESVPGEDVNFFYCITQSPYVGILAQTPDGLIPIVRQFRPCVEKYTWEFPGGTLDPGESSYQAARRELLEEVGLNILEIKYLGNFYPDTGRLQLDSHGFFARTSTVDETFVSEPGMSVKYVSPQEFKNMVITEEFRCQLHIALYALASLHGIDLEAFYNSVSKNI